MKKANLRLANTTIYTEYHLNGKQPLVLIHGFVSSIHTFHRLIPYLKDHYSIIAIDLPGFGRSEKSTKFVYSYKNYAEIVLQCMDHFKIKEATIVGHSMGGQVAMYTALQDRDRVNKLVLLSSSGYLKKAKKSFIYSTYLPFFHLIAKHKIKQDSVRKNLENVLYDHSLITEELISEYERPLNEKAFPKALVRLARHREGDLPSEQLRRINIPALLIWGKQDKVVPLKIGRQLATDLPLADLVVYNHTGHLITEERPIEISNQIRSFTDT